MIAKSKIGQEIERALENYKQIQKEADINPKDSELVQRYSETKERLDKLEIPVNPISLLEDKIE